MGNGIRFAAILGVLCCFASACGRRQNTAQIASALQAKIEAAAHPPYVGGSDEARHLWQETRRFYQQNAYRPVWTNGTRARSQLDGLIHALRGADAEGLNPADYRVDELASPQQTKLDDTRAVDVDIEATYEYLKYAWHLTRGTVDPEEIDSHWYAAPRNVDLHDTLQNGIDENRIEDSLQRLAPASPQYQGLKHQLARYRAMPASPAVNERIEKIALNMERWRWMPEQLGDRYLIVNIPAYRLDAVEHGKSVLAMKVVVGKSDNRTPVLSDRMTYIVFSPYWNIPPEIVEKETLPLVLKDSAYLERNNIEIVRTGSKDPEVVDPSTVDWNEVGSGRLRFRQRPGKGNSLGLVKFVFPNHFNVYLHDTPAQSLFTRIERDFSHGCVRVERPLDLVRYVLRDQSEWTDEKIDQAMHAGVEQNVTLKQPIPVYLAYFTAWEENGDVQIGDDPYGYDRTQRTSAGE